VHQTLASARGRLDPGFTMPDRVRRDRH
jgi:hypothetical protein